MLSQSHHAWDLFPALLLKSTLPAHIQILTYLINTSFKSCTVPREFQKAAVTPLLNNTTFNRNTLKNYRPVSSLSFVSKILGNVAAKLLVQYLTDSDLHEELQSAYIPRHSTLYDSEQSAVIHTDPKEVERGRAPDCQSRFNPSYRRFVT